MVPTQGPRLDANINPVICIVRITVHRQSLPQNLPLRVGGSLKKTVAAARETVMVIRRTEPARMGLPRVEPD
jgi:hypothetical protein